MKAREQQVAERPVLEQQRPQHLALDGDVAHRLGHHGGQVDGLAGQQVQLAEEARGAVADDLVPGGVEDRRLALEDRDERVALVADARRARRRPRRCAPRRSAASVSSCEADSSGLTASAIRRAYSRLTTRPAGMPPRRSCARSPAA